MIVIKLQGGLGNQLFQYALGRALAMKNSADLALDLSWFHNHPYRSYELDNFNISAHVATEDDLGFFISPLEKLFDRFRAKGRKRRVLEEKPGFDKSILELGDNHYFIGYWQSEKYFKGIETILKKELAPRMAIGSHARAWSNKIAAAQSASIHIRRGDYVTNTKFNAAHGTAPISYYARAAEYLARKKSAVEFFVFSDDIDWAKENLRLPYPTHFVSTPELKIIEEFTLMSRCHDNILANSSFSWWAAWLNANALKTVIAPRQWYADTSRIAEDLLPDAWYKM